MSTKKKSVEDKYKKHTHREHILELPDTYVGSCENCTDELWYFNEKESRMAKKNIEYNPALLKLFDEGLVNSVDHATRLKVLANENPDVDIKQVTTIKININDKEISIYNDGDGIDVEMHSEHKSYIPTLIFGELLTSTNYDKSQIKHVGGKNGYGAKLINIFSTEFIIETHDHYRNKTFKQTYFNNMSSSNEPKITKKKQLPYTKITYKVDFKKFGIEKYTEDMILLFKKRVYDASAVTDNSVSVYLNDEKIQHKSFEKYIDLYLGNKNDVIRAYENVSERWEIAAGLSNEDKFEQISFVNGISTIKGGKHIDHVVNNITKKLCEYINKKRKINVKNTYIKEHLFVFVKCTIDNPSFDSQTKEALTTAASKFGSKCDVSDKFITNLAKTGIIDKVISLTEFKDANNLKKTDGKKRNILRGIPKLDDANWAGTSKSKQCTLILTEGDSAKSMAVAGLSVVGRDEYGVFPLRGKVLNVRDATSNKIAENAEINNIKKILGLQTGKEYSNINDLRYGSIMIMTDQDVDGSHIKGLLFNVFDTLWPNLAKQDGFMTSMLTPIIKATKAKNTKEFYNLNDYDEWKKNNNNGKGWNIKYYKGLGTSTAKEAKEYFENLKVVKYTFEDECKNNIDKAFNKNRADDRKKWLQSHDKSNVLDSDQEIVTYSEFINKDLIQFSIYDTERSLPNIMDGLKTSQRKILFSAFKRNLKNEIRVAQFAGYVSEHAAYHHGETSLQGAIIGLAQNFVGSNNINLFKPNGQFGTRLMGGKDAASCRYIHTELSNITSDIFKKEDESILKYLDDDGLLVEPEYYLPIIPMILVNGSVGIGTGFSTNIPLYNPLDIINNIKNKIKGKEFTKMTPWYRGFVGTIERIKDNKFITKGIYKILNNNTVLITELPIGKWTDDYYEYLDSLSLEPTPSKKKNDIKIQYLRNIDKHSTESTVEFILHFMPTMLNKLLVPNDKGELPLDNLLKLTTQKTLSNIHLFDSNCTIKKYDSEIDILEEFYNTRLHFYEVRRLAMLDGLNKDLVLLDAKVRFILDYISDKIIVKNRKIIDIESDLFEMNYPKLDKDNNKNDDGNYNYLLNMNLSSLTLEKKEQLIKERDIKNEMIALLESKTATDLWEDDIEIFKKSYNKFIKDTENSFENDKPKKKKTTKLKKNNTNTNNKTI